MAGSRRRGKVLEITSQQRCLGNSLGGEQFTPKCKRLGGDPLSLENQPGHFLVEVGMF